MSDSEAYDTGFVHKKRKRLLQSHKTERKQNKDHDSVVPEQKTDQKKKKKGRAVRLDPPPLSNPEPTFRSFTRAQFREMSTESQLGEILAALQELPIEGSPFFGVSCIGQLRVVIGHCLDNRDRISALLFGFGLVIPEIVASSKQKFMIYFHSNDPFGRNHVGFSTCVDNSSHRADDPQSVQSLERFLKGSEAFFKDELDKFKESTQKQHRVQFECFPNSSCGIAPFVQFRDAPTCGYCMELLSAYQTRIRTIYSQWKEETSMLGSENCPLRLTVIRAFPDPEREAVHDVCCRFESLIPFRSELLLKNGGPEYKPTAADKRMRDTLSVSKARGLSMRPTVLVPNTPLLKEYTALYKELDKHVDAKTITEQSRTQCIDALVRIKAKTAYKDGVELLMVRKFRNALESELLAAFQSCTKNPESLFIRLCVAGENEMEGFMPSVMCSTLGDSQRSKEDLRMLLNRAQAALVDALSPNSPKYHYVHIACHDKAAVGLCPYVVLKDHPLPQWGQEMVIEWSDGIRALYAQHVQDTQGTGGPRVKSTMLRCNEDDYTEEDKAGIACFFVLDKMPEKVKHKLTTNDYDFVKQWLYGMLVSELTRV